VEQAEAAILDTTLKFMMKWDHLLYSCDTRSSGYVLQLAADSGVCD
jgi:hypothetical protein